MPFALTPIVTFYDYALQPLPGFSWLGAHVSTLEVLGALRVALILRQIREVLLKAHVASAVNAKDGALVAAPEVRGRARDVATTLVMVYGGEAILAPWLGFQPSFMLSGVTPGLFVGAYALLELLPSTSVPQLGFKTELPAALVDAVTRAMRMCNQVPRIVTQHASPVVATSPWTLLLSSLLLVNGGPFFAGAFSLLSPTPMNFKTPVEFLPYGWTATDLWAAPVVTALYATLTHSQPFFTSLHTTLFRFFEPLGLASLAPSATDGKFDKPSDAVMPVDANTARAACVLVLGTLYVTRAVKNFGPARQSTLDNGEKKIEKKTKVQ